MIYEILAAKSREVEIGYWQARRQCRSLFEAFDQIDKLQEQGFDVIDLRVRGNEEG